MNIDVFDVDCGGERFKRVVIEAVQRGKKAQVFRDALSQRLAESVILDRQRHVVAQHLKGFERVFFVHRIAGAASEGDYSGEFAPDSKRADALEQFGRDISVRTQKDVGGGAVEQHRAAGSGQGVHMAGKQRDQRWFGKQGESLGIDRGQQRRPFAE